MAMSSWIHDNELSVYLKECWKLAQSYGLESCLLNAKICVDALNSDSLMEKLVKSKHHNSCLQSVHMKCLLWGTRRVYAMFLLMSGMELSADFQMRLYQRDAKEFFEI